MWRNVKNVGTSRVLWQCIQQALVRVLKNAVFFSVIMALSHNSLAGAVSLSITKKLRVWQSCYLRGLWSACVSFICHIECMLHTVSHTNYNQLAGTFGSWWDSKSLIDLVSISFSKHVWPPAPQVLRQSRRQIFRLADFHQKHGSLLVLGIRKKRLRNLRKSLKLFKSEISKNENMKKTPKITI